MRSPSSSTIETAQHDQIDVAGFQRLFFVSNAQWAADLLQSLTRDPPIEIGPLMFWAPEKSDRPHRGRYQDLTDAQYLSIDGQKRLTALIAAQDLRPTWWLETRWQQSGEPALEAGLVIYSRERMHFRPLRPTGSRKSRSADFWRRTATALPTASSPLPRSSTASCTVQSFWAGSTATGRTPSIQLSVDQGPAAGGGIGG
ncbi:hypothetical protein ACFCWG_18300 [Streptomyces sp. NPDC056390]|uniref:hypothetical protein n=1 Tax=Streptomyces sp. NPDC056390 TaxID=3345806 RepID=UPI0035DF4FE3